MNSQWYELKNKALDLRKSGYSIRKIEARLNISRSTLSGWFKNVVLSEVQKKKLSVDHSQALDKARAKALVWHNEQKLHRLALAREQAEDVIGRMELNNKDIIDLALSMIYLGEGYKASANTALGSSSPLILKFFIKALQLVYKVDKSVLRCELHLRADQDQDSVKKFWGKELGLPTANFTSVSFDKRTSGIKTYDTYMGVCVVRCGRSDIQRKILNLAELFCKKLIDNMGD